MFKFVEDNVRGAGTKRKQNPASCEHCKRGHRRCSHGEQPRRFGPLGPSSNRPEKTSERDVPGARDWSEAATNDQVHVSKPESGSESQGEPKDAHMRFVANLSPESAFITGPHRAGTRSVPRHGVGLWIDQEHDNGPKKAVPFHTEGQEKADAFHGTPDETLYGIADSNHGLLLSNLRPALRRECLTTIPPERELGLLSEHFFATIDPIFPILQGEPWEKHGPMETVALKQCICLVSSLDPAMRSHLRLPHSDVVLSQMEFRARIAAVVKQALDLGFIVDKIVLLQLCTLMSMYVEDQGLSELSTYYCAQAVLHEQTLGFHVGWPDGKAGGERSRRIFWCVYVLDRLNAATNGRPTLIHRRDMDRKVMESVDDQEPAFKLLIHIAQFLDHTISLYRPHTTVQTGVENNGQTFEELVETTGAHRLSNGLLASLELFYLSVVILRGKPQVAGQQPSTELQWFCAARVMSVVSGEFKASLIFWPLLPFSVTVAASVAYRSLRSSPIPYNRRRAYMLFKDSCSVLDELSQAFVSAQVMARLVRDTMQEVERVANERKRRDSIGRPLETPASVGVTETQRNTQEQPRDTTLPLAIPEAQITPGTALNALEEHADVGLPYGIEEESGLFGNLAPNFDLGRVDAIFSANLDLSVSHSIQDWSEPEQFLWDRM